MSYSETITRTDLTNILNEVLPFSFTEFRHHKGSVSVPNNTLVQVHSETFVDGAWLILTTLETISGGSNTANAGQNRLVDTATDLIYSHKGLADTSIVNPNFYVLESANNTTIRLDAYQATGNNQTQEWTYTAIRIGDKFAQAEADYVVEQGTSGDTTYRKWNSGIAECWINTTKNVALNNSYGSLYQGSWTWTFPFTFVAEPTVVVGRMQWGTGASWGTLASASTTSCGIRGIDITSRASGTTYISAYAKGRWK